VSELCQNFAKVKLRLDVEKSVTFRQGQKLRNFTVSQKLSICLAELSAPTPKECPGQGCRELPVQVCSCSGLLVLRINCGKRQYLFGDLGLDFCRHCPGEKESTSFTDGGVFTSSAEESIEKLLYLRLKIRN
jgi:hypothetical protein